MSGCGHDGRLRRLPEAFLLNFITSLGQAGEAGGDVGRLYGAGQAAGEGRVP
jgi:hypothetical protein